MPPHPLRWLLPGATLALACTGDPDGKKGDVEVSQDGNLTTLRTTATTDGRGTAEIDVPVDGHASFLVTARTRSGEWPSVEYLEDADGRMVMSWEDWYGAYSLTSAIFPEARDTALNWPVRPDDGALEDGTWTVAVAVTDDQGYYLSGETLDVVVQLREDQDGFGAGRVQVALVYADGLADDAEVVRGTEGAIARWREVWAAYGVELVLTTAASGIDPDLSDLYGPDDDVYDQSAAGTDSDITVLIGETIGGLDSYGIAGGIPGMLTESERGAVVISWLANAGGDEDFSEEDMRIYGETLAHEVGHYAGLFHPVEDGWDYWDALDDTDEAGTSAAASRASGRT